MPTIRDRVRDRYPSLTDGQKQLIQQMLTDYEEFVFLTVNEAATRLDVHKSTLVRLAQGLGYNGYAGLRAQLQDLYRQEITPEQKLGRTLADVQEGNLYSQVVETEISYLKESLKTIQTADIHAAALMLSAAHRIFIYGKKPQNQLADEFEFRLRRFQMNVWAISDEGRATLDMFQLLSREDVLVVISFNAFLKEHLDAISIAKDVGCPILLLTDTVAKDMLQDVDLILAARRGPATLYHTNIVPMAIIAAIILDVARINADRVLPSLERLHDLRRRCGYEGSLYHHGHLSSITDHAEES